MTDTHVLISRDLAQALHANLLIEQARLALLVGRLEAEVNANLPRPAGPAAPEAHIDSAPAAPPRGAA